MSIKGIGIYDEDTFSTEIDLDVYQESISRILLTSPGERVLNPLFGSRLKELLFELDFVMQEEVNGAISKAITRWEPRVNIKLLETSRPSPDTFAIHLILEEKETLETFTFERLIGL